MKLCSCDMVNLIIFIIKWEKSSKADRQAAVENFKIDCYVQQSFFWKESHISVSSALVLSSLSNF